MAILLANNATAKLLGSLTTSATSFSVEAGKGALFPAPTGGDWFPVTLIKATGELEIVKCTARSGDLFTVTRAQEGTTAKTFSAGDRVSLRITKAVHDQINTDTASAASAAATANAKAETADGKAEAAQTTADLINAPRVDVASASNVSLTVNAPDTRNINITGTTTITGFTVAAGLVYFVRFDGALTLTNNAAIITNSSTGNISVKAGDTCILRAKAANVVEVLCFSPYQDNAGLPVLSTEWISKRAAMWTGYAAADGQTLSRTLYPDAWAAISAGLVPVCTEAEWIADPAKRGCYTTGDGSTTFRVPDYNGAYSGSYGPVYLGGGTSDGGTILRDQIQNITGTAGMASTSGAVVDGTGLTGAFKLGAARTNRASPQALAGYDLAFDASLVVRTGDTTRPITAEGCIAIKLFGAVQNAGSADAAALATAVAALAARVTVLEARKFTTLIPATYPSGAPHDTHETVDAALPANIAANTRYVLTNPFGVNTRVHVTVELYLNGKWADPGHDGNTGTGTVSGGTVGHYVQGEGIIVQTGSANIATQSALLGGGHGITSTTGVTSAPCRVAVRKWEE